MFGLFQPRPPLNPWEKAWVEDRMCTFAEQLGISRLFESPTLTDDYPEIPDIQGPDDVHALVDFLQAWTGVSANDVNLQVFSETIAPDDVATMDHDEKPIVIKVRDSDFQNRNTLIAQIVQELSRSIWSATAETTDSVPSDEWTVELLPAYLGLAIFGANSTLSEMKQSTATLSWWSIRQRGNLPARMFGYAMALRAWVRDEQTEQWSDALRQDARTALDDGLRYLAKTRDTVFSKESETSPRGKLPVNTLLDELRTGSPSRKVSTIWDLENRAQESQQQCTTVSELLMECLRHKYADVRATAAKALPRFDRSQHAAQDIADALNDSSEEVRIAAAGALADFPGVDDQTIVHDLTAALKDDVRLVVFNAAKSLTHYGQAAEPATKMLLRRLRRSLVECRDEDTVTIMWALNAIVDDAQRTIDEYFVDSDQEFRDHATEILQQLLNYSGET